MGHNKSDWRCIFRYEKDFSLGEIQWFGTANPWNLKKPWNVSYFSLFWSATFPRSKTFFLSPFWYSWNFFFILNMIKPQQVQVYQLINVISMAGHTKNVRIRVVIIRQNVTSVLSSIFEVILVNDLTNVTNVNMLQSLLVIWRSTIELTLARNHSNVHIVTMHAEQGEI